MEHQPMAEPPEGVISGDSIPRENEEEDIEESVIQEAVAALKTVEAYQRKSDDELREMAKERLM